MAKCDPPPLKQTDSIILKWKRKDENKTLQKWATDLAQPLINIFRKQKSMLYSDFVEAQFPKQLKAWQTLQKSRANILIKQKLSRAFGPLSAPRPSSGFSLDATASKRTFFLRVSEGKQTVSHVAFPNQSSYCSDSMLILPSYL